MNVLSDSNILFAQEVFGRFGTITLCDGRQITREKLRDTDILLVRSVTNVNRELLEGTPVKFVASATIGTDHIDQEFLRENNIGFACAPGSNANAVAEYVIAAILYCAKKNGQDPANCTIGIIGVGNVGSRVLSLAQALGMRCLLNDPPKKSLTNSELYVSLEQVLAESDFVTVHVPLYTSGETSTYHLINAGFLSNMKTGSVLINTSRGDVLEEPALAAARKKLGGLVLDVWSNEPKPQSSTVTVCDIATPHIAGYSHDGKICGTKMISESASAFFFMDNIWQPVLDAADAKKIAIDKTDHLEIIQTAVSSAYDIFSDHARMRKILELDASKRGEYFDSLRKNYPRRLEFNNFSVVLAKGCPDSAVASLLHLGFKVVAA